MINLNIKLSISAGIALFSVLALTGMEQELNNKLIKVPLEATEVQHQQIQQVPTLVHLSAARLAQAISDDFSEETAEHYVDMINNFETHLAVRLINQLKAGSLIDCLKNKEKKDNILLKKMLLSKMLLSNSEQLNRAYLIMLAGNKDFIKLHDHLKEIYHESSDVLVKTVIAMSASSDETRKKRCPTIFMGLQPRILNQINEATCTTWLKQGGKNYLIVFKENDLQVIEIHHDEKGYAQNMSVVAQMDLKSIFLNCVGSPDGKYIIANVNAALDRDDDENNRDDEFPLKIFSFDAQTKSLVLHSEYQHDMKGFHVSPDGKYLLGRCSAVAVNLFSFIDGKLNFIKQISLEGFSCNVAWSPDSKYFAFSGSKTIQFSAVDPTTKVPESIILELDSPIDAIAFHPLIKEDTMLMVTTWNDTKKEVIACFLPKNKTQWIASNLILGDYDFPSSYFEANSNIAFSSHGIYSAMSWARQVHIAIEFPLRHVLGEIEMPASNRIGVACTSALSWSPDGRYLVYSDDDEDYIKLFDVSLIERAVRTAYEEQLLNADKEVKQDEGL